MRTGQPLVAVIMIRSAQVRSGHCYEVRGDLKNEWRTTGERQTEPVRSSNNCRESRRTLRREEGCVDCNNNI